MSFGSPATPASTQATVSICSWERRVVLNSHADARRRARRHLPGAHAVRIERATAAHPGR